MRKPITLSIEESLIKKGKKIAIDKDTNLSKMIESWISELENDNTLQTTN